MFPVETRGFNNTSGRLKRRHQEENVVPTWSFLQCKMRLQSFPSSSRPNPPVTERCSQELANESLGSLKKVHKSMSFYKAPPLTLANSKHHLGALNLSLEHYHLLPSSQRDRMLQNHPQEDKQMVYRQQKRAPILEK